MLRKLSLNDNPLTDAPVYRAAVLAILPQVTDLDQRPVRQRHMLQHGASAEHSATCWQHNNMLQRSPTCCNPALSRRP
jgi:hypothetical protein